MYFKQIVAVRLCDNFTESLQTWFDNFHVVLCSFEPNSKFVSVLNALAVCHIKNRRLVCFSSYSQNLIDGNAGATRHAKVAIRCPALLVYHHWRLINVNSFWRLVHDCIKTSICELLVILQCLKLQSLKEHLWFSTQLYRCFGHVQTFCIIIGAHFVEFQGRRHIWKMSSDVRQNVFLILFQWFSKSDVKITKFIIIS